MRIYTKTGDKGKSSLYDGSRVLKTDDVFIALGDIDELNAHIGIALDRLWCDEFNPDYLRKLQHILFDVGSYIANPKKREDFPSDIITEVETHIDLIQACPIMKKLTKFILPSGPASYIHVCRSICRRAERSINRIEKLQNVKIFMNRLSDYLFVLSRFHCAKFNYSELVYSPYDTNA